MAEIKYSMVNFIKSTIVIRAPLSLDGFALLPELPDHRGEGFRVDAVLAQFNTDRQAVGVETSVQELRYVLRSMKKIIIKKRVGV